MLRKLVNECKFTLKITTQGPLLVKSGHATPHGPDMTPVLTYRNNQEQVFIPGSSIKGVFRSHIEKIIRTLNESSVCALESEKGKFRKVNNELVCPNYIHVSCGNKFELRRQSTSSKEVNDDQNNRWRLQNLDITLKPSDNPILYSESCPACRLFGSTFFSGRVSPNDAYLIGEQNVKKYTENRDVVGIDRFSGGAADKAKFELQVVSAGVTFETEIYLKNFEVWQLGAMMAIVQDLEDELIRIGSGRSRGLGKIKGSTGKVVIQYVENNLDEKKANEIWGLGKFLANDPGYGTSPDDILSLDKAPNEDKKGIRRLQEYENGNLTELKTKSIEHFVEKMKAWQIPRAMRFEYLQFEEVNHHG